MSMYKNIFVNENADDTVSVQIQGIDGEIQMFGASAFASLEEAVSAVSDTYSNAVVKVASGKYDSFYVVVNNGEVTAPSKVVAVDFDGGTMMTSGGEVTVTDSGFSAEAQLAIIDELNAANAANGTIYVADADAADTTLLVGMGEANYVVGQSASAVYGENAEEVYTVVNNVQNVDMLAATEVASGQNIYFPKETKTSYIFKAGSVAHNEQSKWDMMAEITIEAGASLVAGRNNAAAIAANTPQNAHIKNKLTLAGTADNKAVLNFLSDTRQDSSLAVLWNGNLQADYADIYVADFGFTGSASINNCNVYVDGVVAFGKGWFSQTMTDTTMDVRGHNRQNENTYYSTEGVILNKLTMTNSTINVNDGVDGTTTEKVTIKDLTMNGSNVITEGAVDVTGTLKIDSSSLLQADTLTFGSSGKITLNILDGFAGGKIIDITGATGLTNDILSNITLNGAADGLSVGIVDGDIFIVKESAALEFKEDENATLTDKVIAQNVNLTNSKELAVTGSINALDSATITNAKVEGEEEGKLNGGYDAEGKELAAKITAENNIILQNDGHANVDLDANTIIIANNSKNTLTGNIGTADTENVIIADGEATADGVTIDGNGTIDGAIKNATITAANIEIGGQEVSDTTINGYTEIISDSSFTDVATSGIVSVGFKNENAADTTLTMAGETSIGTLYVGKEGRENEYKAVISGEDTEVTLGNLYNRTDSVVEVTDGATANIGYWQSKGSVLIDDATVNHTGVNMYVYNNDSTSAAEIKLTNGATLNSDANYAIYLGNSEGGPAKGNAKITLESGSTLNTKNLTLHADGVVEEVAGAAAKTSVSVTDSTLNVTGKMTNNGTVTVGGESELNIAAATGKAIDFADGAVITSTTGANFSDATHSIGGVTFGSGKFNFAGGAMAYDKLALNAGADVTAAQTFAVYDDTTIADGASVSANSVYVNGGNVTLAGDLTAKGNDGGLLLRNSNKSFNVDGGNVDVAYIEGTRGTVAVNLTNATVKGGHHITDNGGTLNWDIDNSSVSARTWTNTGAIDVNNGEITVTEKLTNNGTFTVAGESTLKIANLSGDADITDAELQDGSYITNGDGTIYFNGSNAIDGEVTIGSQIYNYGKLDVKDGATFTNQSGEITYLVGSGASLNVAENATVKVNDLWNNVQGSAVSTIDGTAEISHNAWLRNATINGSLSVENQLAVYSNDAFNVNGELTINGNGSPAGWLIGNPGSSTGAYAGNITVNVTGGTVNVTGNSTGEEIIIQQYGIFNINSNALHKSGTVSVNGIITNKGEVNITDGSMTSNYKITNSGTMNVTDGVVTASSITNTGTISLTVTDEKLASLGGSAYYMVNQTGSGAALNLGVSYNGTVYNIGDSITVGDVVYNVVAGDGNDIAIQAEAKTVVIDSTLTTNGFNQFATAGEFFELHDSYDERIQGNPEKIVVNGTNVLDTDKSKYFVYSDSDLSISGGTLDVSKAGRFYFMDTVAPNGTAIENADFSDVATVTIEEGATLKGYINLGQAIDNGDFDENGNATRDGGAMNMVVKGTLDQKNLYVNSGSTLTVTETGKVTHYSNGGDNHIRANAKVVVNGTGKDGDVQFASNWWSIRGGEMEFNNTNAETGTLRLNADNENALVTGDTTASLTVNNSRLDAYTIEVDNADSSFTAKDSIIETTLLENAGTATVTGDSTLQVNKLVGTLNVADATINDGSFIKGKAGSIDISGDEVNFDGNVTIEAALNANKSSDATTINVNDGAVVTIAGKEYDQYNGGVNLGASDTLNVDGTLNISGDNLYLKATTNVNEGGELNITDAGFQNTYGKLTVKGDMNITDTFSDGAYQNIKLAGNDNASTTGSLDVDGGTLTIDAPSFAFGGGFKSNGWVDVTSADVTVQNGGKITTNAVVFRNGANSTMTLDNGTLEFTEAGDFGTVHVTLGTQIDNYGTINVTNGSTLDLGDRSLVNEGIINVSNSTLADIKISGAGETGYVRAEDAVLSNVTVTGQETRTVNTDFNGGTYTGKVYTGYGLVDGEWVRVTDSETTINGTVDASSVYWQNYGKLTIAEGAELKTSYFSEGSKQVLTVDGTISAGTFRGYNGVVSETGKINAQAAVQFYGNPDTKRQYDINGEVVVTHDIAYAHNIVVGFDTAKQWYGDGPNDYWNIGGANTEVNVSGEKAKLQIVAGKAGKGTAMIHVDEEGTKATLNISDKARFLVDGKVINNGNLNIADNAVAVISGNVTNSGSITVDASSSFSAGAIVNNGSFNSDNAGEMVVLGEMTVSGNIQTADLILNRGAALSAGSITVDNLTLALGSELSLTGTGSSVAADFITVTGEIGSAEYQLVLTGWTGDLLGKEIKFDANGDGTIGSNEIFTVKNDTTNLSGVNFVAQDGKLYVKDFGADTTTIFIGDLSGEVDGKITIDGVTYTVGVDAFASAADAAAVVDADKLTEITVGNGDHINEVAASFGNIGKINVPGGIRIEDAAAAEFNGDLVISNDGHLDADITAAGKVTMTNTSSNTFTGELTGADVDVINTATGKVENATLEANAAGGGTLRVDNLGVIENTEFKAVDGMVDVTGNGTFTNVDVTADTLYLNGLDFTLDADSSVNSIYMDEFTAATAGKLTLDGASVGVVYSNGTGELEFTANSKMDNVSVENVDTVTLSGGIHQFSAITDTANKTPLYYMNNLNIGNAEFNWNFSNDQVNDYNIGTPIDQDQGMIKVNSTDTAAVMNFNQTGAYDLKDLDVSNFGGAVNIASTATLDLEDATDYFKDGAVLDVDGVLNLNGAGAFTNTAMDFNGDGDINVMKDHTFTAVDALNGFSGDLTVGDTVTLTLGNANDTDAIFHGAGDVVAESDLTLGADMALNDFSGNIQADTKVVLDGVNETAATFSGEGTVDVQKNQILTSDDAISNVEGTLNAAAKLTLNGENSIQATLTGDGDILANADQDFTGNVSAFTGSYEAAAAKTVTFTAASTLASDMELNGAGKFELADHNANVTVNSDTADATELVINNNKVTLVSGVYDDITGEAGKLTIDADIIAADVKVGTLIINDNDNLNAATVNAADVIVMVANTNDYGPAITVAGTSDFGNISVVAESSRFDTPFTIVDSNVGQNYGDSLQFILANTGIPGYTLDIDGLALKIDGYFVRAYTEGNDLLIGNYKGESNVVYVNSDWNTVAGTVYKWTGIDGTPDRIIDLDASKTLQNAVAIIRGDDSGKGEIYLVKGNTYRSPAALMTADNGVTELVITADEVDSTKTAVNPGDVSISGGIVAMEAAGSGKLTINNVSVSGNVYGGAIVTGDAGTAADSTSLTLNGGTYRSSNIAGGSFVKGGNYTVGDSELVIKNDTGAAMNITGRVLGGSMVSGSGAVVQESASVVIDTDDGKISIRGDIYAAGSGNVSVTNSSVTFTGDAANLTFTGRVSGQAYNNANAAENSQLVFDDFNAGYGKTATFQGLIQGMDEVVISGNSKVTFSRKQTLMSDTDIVFDVDGMVAYKSTAMFTVNSFGWTYDDIVVKGGDLNSGTYTLAAGFDFAADTTIGYSVVNGSESITVSVNEWVEDASGNRYLLTESANELFLQVIGSSDIVVANTSGEVTLDYSDARLVIGDNAVIDNDQPGKDVAALKEIVLGDNATFNFNNMSSSNSAYTDAGRWLKNSTITTTGNNAEVNIASTGKWVGAAGFTIGEGVTVTAENMGFDNSSAADTVINGTVVGTDIVQMNSYGQAGAVIVNGTLEAGAWGGVDVKNGTELVVNGTVATPGDFDVWTSTANTVTVNGGNIDVTGGGHIHIWEAAHVMDISNGSTINYGYNFQVGNAGNGVEVTVDDSTLQQSVTSTSNSVIQSGNSVTLQNGSSWNLGNGKLSIVGDAKLSVNTGSVINGNIIGDANDNAIAMDVNSVLNGAVDFGGTADSDTLNITGIEALNASAGAKALVAGEVSNVEEIKIDGVAVAANGAATQIEADLWAQVNSSADGLVVAWGRTDIEAGAALDAFKADSTLTLGEALVAVDDSLLDGFDSTDNLTKKNNGTLA